MRLERKYEWLISNEAFAIKGKEIYKRDSLKLSKKKLTRKSIQIQIQ